MRNRIRLELLPRLAREYNPAIVEALLRLGRLAREAQGLVDFLVEDLRARALGRERTGAVRLSVPTLAGQPRYLVRETLIAVWRGEGWPMQAMGLAEWESLAAMAEPAAGAHGGARRVYPGAILADRTEDTLRLVRMAAVPR